SLADMAAFARLHKIPFPILKDSDNALADRLGAVRTPEVFVLDRQRVVRYHGRIDDQYVIGIQRVAPTQHDLARALNELLAGQPVSQPFIEPVGCHIGRLQKTVSHGEVTYTRQISRLLNRRCVECHRAGEIAPFPLTSYRDATGWAAMMRE